jgi:L-alanine-DL-glutamate epimerase-like enolase superfamily enzyme
VVPHAWHDIHVHCVASAPNATYAEFMPDDHIVNFRRLIDVQIKDEDGQLLLPQTPGLGFVFAPDAMALYGVTQRGEESCWQTVR